MAKSSAADIASRIKPVSELETFERVLIYGRSGTGKTSIAGTFPGPILVVNPGEHGTSTLAKIPDVEHFPVESWEDLEGIYWYLRGEGAAKYKTVVIDTVTRLQDLAIAAEQKNEERLNKMGWGNVSQRMKAWLINFRDLPMHVVFTAQDRETETEDLEEDGTLMPDVGPYAMPSVAKTLCAAVEVIGCTFIREREVQAKNPQGQIVQTTKSEYCLRIGPHARYTTKIRADKAVKIPKLIVDPTYQKIADLRKGVTTTQEVK